MRIPLATDIKTRTGAPDKDARIKNAYVETRGDQSVVRKRPIAQGGISVATVGSIAQGGIAFTTSSGGNGVFFLNGDTQGSYSEDGTTWSAATNYSIGDHVTVNWEDYWALTDNLNQNPTANPDDWSTEYVPAVVSYATWNPSEKGADIVLSNGNLTVTNPSDTTGSVRATKGKSSGKWYWEVTYTAGANYAGVATSSANLEQVNGADANGWAFRRFNGITGLSFHNGLDTNYLQVTTLPVVVGYKLNMDIGAGSNELGIIYDGVDLGVIFNNLPATVFPADGCASDVASTTANFGQSAFSNAVPSGYNSGVY